MGITVQLNRDNEEWYGQLGTSEESHIQKLGSYLGARLSRVHLDHVIRRQRRDPGGSPTGRWVDQACNLLDVLILDSRSHSGQVARNQEYKDRTSGRSRGRNGRV